MVDDFHTADVLIIGGGIIGCSIAWRLAQARMKVIVLDRSQPGGEASSAAAGMLAPLGEMLEPGPFADLCIASLNLYPAFAAELEESSGQRVGYRNEGSLLVAFSENDEAALAKIQAAYSAQGFPLHAQTAAEVQAHGVGVSNQARGGLFIPSDHWVDNVRLMQALVTACQRAGVRLESGEAVERFQLSGERIESVTTGNNATFSAKSYVLAAGCWSGELVERLGMHLPMSPCRGQMMEFEAPREMPFVVRRGIHYLVPRSPRRVLLGTTSEYVGFEKAVTPGGMLSVLEGVMHLAPVVNEFRFVRAWAGLRPDTADHLPLLGYGEIANLLFATGHFRNGILLAPLTAEIVADVILKGTSSHPIEIYRPTRFGPMAGGQKTEGGSP